MSVGPLAVVMGVSGCGKSTVAAELARALGVPFADGDDFHPPANVAKQAAGIPLDDADREPWLDAIAAWLADRRATGAIVACSALKRSYRERLRGADPTLPFVHLAGPEAIAAARVAARPGHFMPATLVASQYEILEPLQPDERGLVLDFTRPVDALVAAGVAFFRG